VQAILAAKAGASYISPFVGRLDDIATDGMDLVRKIVAIYKMYDFKTEVLVASVRGPNQIVEAALVGAHVATVPFAILQQLVKHPLTDAGLAKFLADWKTIQK
jgi:transaldolase